MFAVGEMMQQCCIGHEKGSSVLNVCRRTTFSATGLWSRLRPPWLEQSLFWLDQLHNHKNNSNSILSLCKSVCMWDCASVDWVAEESSGEGERNLKRWEWRQKQNEKIKEHESKAERRETESEHCCPTDGRAIQTIHRKGSIDFNLVPSRKKPFPLDWKWSRIRIFHLWSATQLSVYWYWQIPTISEWQHSVQRITYVSH